MTFTPRGKKFFKELEHIARGQGKRGLRAHARRMAEIAMKRIIAMRQAEKRIAKIERRKARDQ